MPAGKGPTNKSPANLGVKFYPTRGSHQPNHFGIIQDGLHSILESFEGWEFAVSKGAVSRRLSACARASPVSWPSSGQSIRQDDVDGGTVALVATVPEPESIGETINLHPKPRGRRAKEVEGGEDFTASLAEADFFEEENREEEDGEFRGFDEGSHGLSLGGSNISTNNTSQHASSRSPHPPHRPRRHSTSLSRSSSSMGSEEEGDMSIMD